MMKIKNKNSIIFLLGIVLLWGNPAFGAEKTSASTENGKFYLDFKETKLINALMILSELTGINFVAGKEISNREVNLVLENVTLQDTLEALVRGCNIVYEFIPQRNIYLFRAAADAENMPPLVSRVFRLYYVMVTPIKEIETGDGGGGSSSGVSNTFSSLSETKDTSGGDASKSSQIVTIVQNMLSERGKVTVDNRSNSLIVTDTEDRVKTVGQVIAQLDQKLDQIMIEVNLIETSEDLDRFFGIEWGKGSEGSFGTITGGIARTRFPFNNPVLGSSWLDKKVTTDAEEFATTLPDTTTFGTKDLSGLTATLKMLQTAQKIKVIAKPKILVLDNHPALIKITTNSAIGSNEVGTAAGNVSSTTNTTERAETGTSLRLTPHINLDGRITMTVEPRFVTLAESVIVASKGDPTIRTARTTMMVKDQQTIVIGGMLSSQQTKTDRKVPYFGDLPLIGEAFTKHTKNIEDRELILFITPKIVKDPTELAVDKVPNKRQLFDDEAAPFWKLNRKEWYKHQFEDENSAMPSTSMETSISKNQVKAMDAALEKLSAVNGGTPSAQTPVKIQTSSSQQKTAG